MLGFVFHHAKTGADVTTTGVSVRPDGRVHCVARKPASVHCPARTEVNVKTVNVDVAQAGRVRCAQREAPSVHCPARTVVNVETVNVDVAQDGKVPAVKMMWMNAEVGAIAVFINASTNLGTTHAFVLWDSSCYKTIRHV